MTDEATPPASDDAGPLRRIGALTPLQALETLREASRSSGLPCTYLTVQHTHVEGEGLSPRDRLLIDLESADVTDELDRSCTVRSPGSDLTVVTTTVTRFRHRHFASAESLLDFLSDRGAASLLERQKWYRARELLTGDWNYWLDPGSEWPNWCLIGCDSEIGPDGPALESQEVSGLKRGPLQGAQLSAGTLAMMPFAALRFKQDLIRLDVGRLRQIGDRAEEVLVGFILGTLGWTYALANRAKLRFQLFGEQQQEIHQGDIALTDDHFHYGVTLTPPAHLVDRRIFAIDLALMLNETVVDKSFGAFLRSIQIAAHLGQET